MSTTTLLPPQPAIGTLVTGNRLLMIGDSITASAAKRYGGEFCKALVPLGWQVEVDAEPSRFVDFGNAVLDKRLSAKWDAAYVFLGSNYLGDQESYRKQLERIVQRLSPTPVVLLTVTEFEDNRREVNDAITLVSAEFPNVHLLDWGSIAAANADTILRGDGLHLTNDGRAVLASTIAGVMGQGTGAARRLPQHIVQQRLRPQRQRQRHAVEEEGRSQPDTDHGEIANRHDRRWRWYGNDQAAGHGSANPPTIAASNRGSNHPTAGAGADDSSSNDSTG